MQFRILFLYIYIQNLWTMQNIHFSQINQTYIRSREPLSNPQVWFDHTNISISYVVVIIQMLNFKKIGSFILKAETPSNIFFFVRTLFWLAFYDIRGVFGLTILLSVKKFFPKLTLTYSIVGVCKKKLWDNYQILNITNHDTSVSPFAWCAYLQQL